MGTTALRNISHRHVARSDRSAPAKTDRPASSKPAAKVAADVRESAPRPIEHRSGVLDADKPRPGKRALDVRMAHMSGATAKWKQPPPGVKVTPNKTGQGHWIEKWVSPTTGKTVYNYTDRFMQQQALKKFRENAEFARTLPQIKQQLQHDLAGRGRDRIVAAVVGCIQDAYFRVGNPESAKYGVFGATTLQAQHLKFEDGKAVFDYIGKKKQPQHRVVDDRAVIAVLRELKAACKNPDDSLFVYHGTPISDHEVNGYLAPFGVTAKQFRTFHATRLCRKFLLEQGDVRASRREQAVQQAIERTAELLGHTPEVCRGSYIDPVVIEAFMAGELK
jgi:DNA topoisomerase I